MNLNTFSNRKIYQVKVKKKEVIPIASLQNIPNNSRTSFKRKRSHRKCSRSKSTNKTRSSRQGNRIKQSKVLSHSLK